MASVTMAELVVDVSKLPEDVREKLAELDLELSEGETCTCKRRRLLRTESVRDENFKRLVTANLLLKLGALPDMEDPDGRSALSHAAEKGDILMTALLLSKGANPNLESALGNSPLYFALIKGHGETAIILAKMGGKLPASDLLALAIQDRLELVAGLGLDLNEKDAEGWSGLHWAVNEGHIGALRKLLDLGLDVNSTTGEFAWTPLHMAAVNGNKNAASLLILYGADMNLMDTSGRTALALAVQEQKNNIVSFLITRTSSHGRVLSS